MNGGIDWNVVAFSAEVAVLSTLIILPLGIGLAWVMTRRDWPGKSFVETVVSLPLVMPPVATGLILLKLFGKYGPIGRPLEGWFDFRIVFTWKAVVLAMSVMSFPLLVRAVKTSFEEIDPRLEEIARTLGAGEWRVFLTITLPLSLRGILAGVILSFSRALGEFGATIMVAGNIPGKTTTLSLLIYGLVQLGKDDQALRLMLVSVVIAFAAIWFSQRIVPRHGRGR